MSTWEWITIGAIGALTAWGAGQAIWGLLPFKPPAGGGGLSPGAAETATPLPGGAVPPAGPDRPPPGPGTTRALADWRVTEWDCGHGHHCVRVINHGLGRITWTRCPRHKFAAEREARLHQ